MGSPMAGVVARAGFDVTAYDIDPARAEALAADGVKPAASIGEAAGGADVLVLMVATPDQVDSVLFGDDPAAGGLAPGATVVVMATVGPAPVQRWAERLRAQQVELVDAPVSGGVARAGEGDLLIMVGGAEPAVERVRPLLDAMARSAPHVGTTAGDGQKVKLVNQLLCGVHIVAAAEALALAEAMQLDPQQPGRCSAAARPRRSCWTTAGAGWCTAPRRSGARWTSSSRTWGWSPTPPAPAATPHRWRPRPNSSSSPAVAPGSAGGTTPPSSRGSPAFPDPGPPTGRTGPAAADAASRRRHRSSGTRLQSSGQRPGAAATITSAPRKLSSCRVAPASAAIRSPAATSQSFVSMSMAASNRPAATQERARAAGTRRRSPTSGNTPAMSAPTRCLVSGDGLKLNPRMASGSGVAPDVPRRERPSRAPSPETALNVSSAAGSWTTATRVVRPSCRAMHTDQGPAPVR